MNRYEGYMKDIWRIYKGYMKDIRIRKSPKSLILFDLVTLNNYYHGWGIWQSLWIFLCIPALDITFCSLLVVGVDLIAPGSDKAARQPGIGSKTCRLHKLSGVLRDSLLTAWGSSCFSKLHPFSKRWPKHESIRGKVSWLWSYPVHSLIQSPSARKSRSRWRMFFNEATINLIPVLPCLCLSFLKSLHVVAGFPEHLTLFQWLDHVRSRC